MPNVTTVTAADLRRRLDAGDVGEFWNVLAPDYFTGELIPGSRWVPVGRVARETIEHAVAKDTTIVVYCSGPSCPNSGDAARKLVTLGFTNVLQFEGGLEAWKSAGFSVEAAPAAVA
jgi:rhodanese-related sulfurtransferase